jgi:hypothetical protein
VSLDSAVLSTGETTETEIWQARPVRCARFKVGLDAGMGRLCSRISISSGNFHATSKLNLQDGCALQPIKLLSEREDGIGPDAAWACPLSTSMTALEAKFEGAGIDT